MYQEHLQQVPVMWRPIETAPKDKEILGYGKWHGDCGLYGPTEEFGIHVIKWHDSKYTNWDWIITGADTYGAYLDATHWMPLPIRPE